MLNKKGPRNEPWGMLHVTLVAQTSFQKKHRTGNCSLPITYSVCCMCSQTTHVHVCACGVCLESHVYSGVKGLRGAHSSLGNTKL